MSNATKSPDWDYLPLITALSSIAEEGYKPADVINDFWNKYTCQEAVSHIFEIYLRMKGKKENLHATEEQLEQYIRDLIHVIMAYYFSHLDVFEKEEVIIDIEKSYPYKPPTPPKDKFEFFLQSILGYY